MSKTMPMTITQKVGLDRKCCDCGIALYNAEIASEFTGTIIDYEKRKPYQTNPENPMTFCKGCWERIMANGMADQGDAILKRKELEKDHPVKLLAVSEAMNEYLKLHPFGLSLPDGTGIGM